MQSKKIWSASASLIRAAVLVACMTPLASLPASAAPTQASREGPARDVFLASASISVGAHNVDRWREMYSRHKGQQGGTSAEAKRWRSLIAEMRALPREQWMKRVNAEVNKLRYVADAQNWRKADYWGTPAEFIARGGDCEEYATTKYLLLRALGVSASSMRVMILNGSLAQPAHAVLVVRSGDQMMVLDNQRGSPYRLTSRITSRAAFALNELQMWVSIEKGPVADALRPRRIAQE